MLTYLVQHAESRPKEEDPARDLSAQGLEDITKVVNFLGQLNLPVKKIFHSGKTRALSTARILAKSLQPPAGVEAATGLAPLDDPAAWADRIAGAEEEIMLVGHLPHLDRLAAFLITGDQEKSVINFKMGGVLCVKRLAEDRWSVEWLVIPEIIV